MNNNNFILILFMAVFLVQCTIEPNSPNNDELYACTSEINNTHPDTERFEIFIDEKVEQGLPGISMLIETPEGLWAGAAGVVDIPADITMRPCSLHRIGSITKLFTAALILQLYETGDLELGALISNYLSPIIIDRLANGEQITVKNLLNHTSGLPDILNFDYSLDYLDNPYRVSTALEDLEYIYDESAEFAVGTKVKYSNTNYVLLGLIAESITSKTGTQLYQDNIFNPLGMIDSFFNQNGTKPSNLVRGYYDESGNGQFIDITDFKFVAHSMAGGASSTVQDLNVFLKAVFTGNNLFEAETIQLATSIENTPFDEPDSFEFGNSFKVKRIKGIGLGWFELETEYGKAYGHNGGYNGRRARMWYFPDSQKTIIFMYNASGESIESIEKELFRNEMVELLFE